MRWNLHYRLGLSAIAVLALVAASTAALVLPELFGGRAGAHTPALLSMFALGHA
ncbi:hypothetical protein G4G28_11855 [Massilia sp. Dwa41.01b]|uniref:hypothetical protein n=1 Tax=Massilia sp. Dwa41.01b TaxID=2709302 RepID=UPI00160006F7|nr:hypothetical protein [Massilia sp. Dwa41.01b]QNA88999.1 hypothetical protein G4G28_11855 [Massilia sp. Dwa41.01b]